MMDTVSTGKYTGYVDRRDAESKQTVETLWIGPYPSEGVERKKVAQELLWAEIKVTSQVRSPKVTVRTSVIAATREGGRCPRMALV